MPTEPCHLPSLRLRSGLPARWPPDSAPPCFQLCHALPGLQISARAVLYSWDSPQIVLQVATTHDFCQWPS